MVAARRELNPLHPVWETPNPALLLFWSWAVPAINIASLWGEVKEAFR